MTLLSSLDSRSRTILQHIVESYLETGNPVGSNTLSKKISPSLASATIRNVMSDLEGLNLLKSPHVSAGRIPTETGLKLFIDGLLQIGDISGDEKNSIEALSVGTGKSLKNILNETSVALSGLSNCVSFVIAPTYERELKHIEFVPIDNDKALVVIVDVYGLVENRIIDVPKGTPLVNLIEASNFINARVSGGTLEEVKNKIEEELLIHKKEIDVISEKVIKAGLAVKTEDIDYPSLIVTGKNNIYSDLSTHEDFKKINKKGKLGNKNIMFTGGFEKMSRSEAKALAEENGAKILGSVSKKLDYLVIGNSKPTKKKIEKAKELKIDLMTEEKWYDLLNR